MQLILRQGRIVDPSQKLNKIMDLGIEDGRVAEIAPKIRKKGRKEIDARKLVVLPGFIDMHVAFARARTRRRRDDRDAARTRPRGAALPALPVCPTRSRSTIPRP